jgi:hypothetical protein
MPSFKGCDFVMGGIDRLFSIVCKQTQSMLMLPSAILTKAYLVFF